MYPKIYNPQMPAYPNINPLTKGLHSSGRPKELCTFKSDEWNKSVSKSQRLVEGRHFELSTDLKSR